MTVTVAATLWGDTDASLVRINKRNNNTNNLVGHKDPLPTSWNLGVAEDCRMLSILPFCVNCFWHGILPTS